MPCHGSPGGFISLRDAGRNLHILKVFLRGLEGFSQREFPAVKNGGEVFLLFRVGGMCRKDENHTVSIQLVVFFLDFSRFCFGVRMKGLFLGMFWLPHGQHGVPKRWQNTELI